MNLGRLSLRSMSDPRDEERRRGGGVGWREAAESVTPMMWWKVYAAPLGRHPHQGSLAKVPKCVEKAEQNNQRRQQNNKGGGLIRF